MKKLLKKMQGALRQIPSRYRRPAYLVFGIGSLVLAYLKAKGYHVGDELVLWNGLGGLFGFTAAANVKADPKKQPKHGKHQKPEDR